MEKQHGRNTARTEDRQNKDYKPREQTCDNTNFFQGSITFQYLYFYFHYKFTQ